MLWRLIWLNNGRECLRSCWTCSLLWSFCKSLRWLNSCSDDVFCFLNGLALSGVEKHPLRIEIAECRLDVCGLLQGCVTGCCCLLPDRSSRLYSPSLFVSHPVHFSRDEYLIIMRLLKRRINVILLIKVIERLLVGHPRRSPCSCWLQPCFLCSRFLRSWRRSHCWLDSSSVRCDLLISLLQGVDSWHLNLI